MPSELNLKFPWQTSKSLMALQKALGLARTLSHPREGGQHRKLFQCNQIWTNLCRCSCHISSLHSSCRRRLTHHLSNGQPTPSDDISNSLSLAPVHHRSVLARTSCATAIRPCNPTWHAAFHPAYRQGDSHQHKTGHCLNDQLANSAPFPGNVAARYTCFHG